MDIKKIKIYVFAKVDLHWNASHASTAETINKKRKLFTTASAMTMSGLMCMVHFRNSCLLGNLLSNRRGYYGITNRSNLNHWIRIVLFEERNSMDLMDYVNWFRILRETVDHRINVKPGHLHNYEYDVFCSYN